MTATYGALARVDYGARTNVTQALPAGVADGDLLFWCVVTGNSTQVTPSLPVGWTAMGSPQTGADAGSFDWCAVMGYRVASSEPASYTATHAACSSESLMIRIDGAGTLSVDAFSQGTHTADGSATTTAPAVTTTAADDLLIFLSLNWDEAALTPPTGMTERQDSQFVYMATQALSASGSTGDRTQAHNFSPWFGNLVAVKDEAGGGTDYTIAADAGSVSVTGTAASLEYARKVSANSGSFAISGTVASLEYGRKVAANSGSWAITGTAASLEYGRKLVADAGSVAVTGTDATLTYTPVSSGPFTDDFTRADEDLGASADWTYLEGSPTTAAAVRSNQLASLATSGESVSYMCPDVDSADHYVECVVRSTTSAGSFAACRLEAGPTYVGIRNSGSSVHVFRCVGGTFTQLYVADHSAVSGDTLRLEVRGDNYSALLNGAEVSAGAIGATLTSTRQGVVIRSTTQNPWIDNFEAGALEAQAYTLTADPGTLSVTGTDAAFNRTYVLGTESAAVAITGAPATLTYSGAAETRQPGGGYYRPIILVDRQGRPVDLKKTANKAVQAAKQAVKELPVEQKQEAKTDIRALEAAIRAQAAHAVAERAQELRAQLAGISQAVEAAMLELERVAAEEAEEEEEAAMLLLV